MIVGSSRARVPVHAVVNVGRSGRTYSSALRAMTADVSHTLATSKHQSDVELALQAVRAASKACMTVQKALQSGGIRSKEDGSPVTVADYAAQAIVAWVLQQATSARLQLVAEEDSEDLRKPEGKAMLDEITQLVNDALRDLQHGASLAQELSGDDVLDLIDLGDSQAGASGKHWVLDPIDGTRGFENLRQYAICLGLLIDGVSTIGVLGCPNIPLGRPATQADGEPDSAAGTTRDAIGAIFAAARGAGAFEGSLDGKGIPQQRIAAARVPALSEAIFMESYDSRHSKHDLSHVLATELGFEKPPLRMDSQCKYGLLARGDGHMFLRFPHEGYREKIWDHAAGIVVFEEAGGVVSDASGAPVDFSKGRYLDGLDRGIVAATPDLHSKLLDVIKKQSAA